MKLLAPKIISKELGDNRKCQPDQSKFLAYIVNFWSAAVINLLGLYILYPLLFVFISSQWHPTCNALNDALLFHSISLTH